MIEYRSGYGDDVRGCFAIPFVYLAECLGTVHDRHADVLEDDIRHLFLNSVERFLPVFSGTNDDTDSAGEVI